MNFFFAEHILRRDIFKTLQSNGKWENFHPYMDMYAIGYSIGDDGEE